MLMIRIANERPSLISNASPNVGLMRINRRIDGQVLRQIYELPLIRSRLPLFTLTWTLMHVIDAASPLYGYDAARLIEDDVHLWVAVERHDNVLATTIVDTKPMSRPTFSAACVTPARFPTMPRDTCFSICASSVTSSPIPGPSRPSPAGLI
jgi:Inward rectifier potassium channel C-terminal domain